MGSVPGSTFPAFWVTWSVFLSLPQVKVTEPIRTLPVSLAVTSTRTTSSPAPPESGVAVSQAAFERADQGPPAWKATVVTVPAVSATVLSNMSPKEMKAAGVSF